MQNLIQSELENMAELFVRQAETAVTIHDMHDLRLFFTGMAAKSFIDHSLLSDHMPAIQYSADLLARFVVSERMDSGYSYFVDLCIDSIEKGLPPEIMKRFADETFFRLSLFPDRIRRETSLSLYEGACMQIHDMLPDSFYRAGEKYLLARYTPLYTDAISTTAGFYLAGVGKKPAFKLSPGMLILQSSSRHNLQ